MTRPQDDRIAAIVLAAGGSRRMGEPKQLLEHDGVPLVRRAVMAALESRCGAVHVVIGAHADAVSAALAGLDVVLAPNAAWRDGLSGSIRCGVESVLARSAARAALLVLVDQPRVTAAVLDRLMDAFDGSPDCAVGSRYAGVVGTPALFGSAHFAALQQLDGDRGARSVLEAAGSALKTIDFADGALDIDTPADWEALASRSSVDASSYSKK